MSGVQTKTVSPDEDGMRLDRWFKAHFPGVTHGQLEKFLRKGQVRVGGGRAKSNRRLADGEEIRIPPLGEKAEAPRSPYRASRDVKADKKFLRDLIIYEDDSLMALCKPFGLAVQGGSKTKNHLDAMLRAFETDTVQPRLVHRLDKDTGGLMLVAKTRQAAQKLGDAFKNHEVDKTYWAITVGAPSPVAGTIDAPMTKKIAEEHEAVGIDRGKGKKAITDYQTVDNAERVAFVAMRPITGRTHQLRVHAAMIGTPILGDGKYGGSQAHIEGLPKKLHLYCRSMSFAHPKTGKSMTIEARVTGHMLETWRFFGFDEGARVEWPELS